MPSQKNTDYLERTKETLKTGKAFYFTDFTGLSVQAMENLRKDIKKNNGSYVVLKNTLGNIAMKELGFEEATINNLFTGPTGIAIAFSDPIVLAKVLTKHENIKIKGSFIEGTFFDTAEVIKFSKIPSKNALYGQLVGSLNILGNFVGILENIIRELINTIEAIQNKEAK